MKKIFVLITMLLFVGVSTSEAQVLKGFGKKLEKKVQERIDRKADRSVDKVLDKVEDKTDKTINNALEESSRNDKAEASTTSVKPNEVLSNNEKMEGAIMLSNNCSDFIWFKSGAMMEFEAKDESDAVVHKSKMVVSKIYSQGEATVADVLTSDNMGNEFTMQFKCANDKLYMDFAAAIEEAMKKAGNGSEVNTEEIKNIRENTEMNFSDGFMSFPKNMYPGQKLEDVVFTMKTGDAQFAMEIVSKLLDRKVDAKEKITTPAGTFDCLKISGKRSSSMKMMGMNKNMGDSTVDYIWFTPGIGVVKQESYSEKGKLINSSQLTAYKL